MKRKVTFLLAFIIIFSCKISGQNIKKAEYFIDVDPGFGLATNISLTPAANIPDIQFNIDITSLSKGFHNLYMRTKDANGIWSITANRMFYREDVTVASNIVKAEYFFDTDPGFGLATNLALTPGTNLTNLTIDKDVTGLTNGDHVLYIRAKDAYGAWSIVAFRKFTTPLQFLSVSSNTLGIAAPANSTQIFDIATNVSWTTASNQGWLTLSNSSGSGNKTITLTATSNPSAATRTATITISGTGVTTQTISVTQDGGLTGFKDFMEKGYLLYPNPVSQILYLSSETEDVIISVLDMKGNVVLNRRINDNKLDVSNLQKGIYTIKIKNSKGTFAKKFIKE
jgi:hypothetical protein